MQATMRKRRQSLRNNPHAEAAESAAAEAAGAIVEQSATQNLLNFVNKIKKENAEEASSSAVQPVVQEIKQEPPESEEMTVEEKLRRPGLICYLCVEPFETKDVLAMHMSRAHRSKNIEEAAALYCPIELCNVVVFSQPQLVVHARSHHSKSSDSKEQKFMSYSRSFDDQDKFKKWRNRSLKSVSTMTCDTSNETENYLETVFHCRPTFAKPNAACPAFSNIRLFKSGKIKITYCFDHLGHVIAPTDSASSNSPDVTTCEDALEVHPDELLGESPSDSTVGDVLRKRLREGVPLDTPPVAAAIAPTNNSVNVVVPEPVVPNRPITNSILPAGFVIRHGLYDDVLEVDEKKFTYRDFYDIIWDFFCFIKTQNETVTCERLKLSAVEIAKRMGLSSFTGNDWWLRSFKRRHKLKFSTMTGEPYNYDNVKEVVLKCEAEDKTVEEVMKMEAEAERQAQKRSVATETSPMGSPFHNFNEFPSDHFHNGGQGSAMEILQALAHSCIIPQKRDDADVSWAFEVIRSRVIQRNISLLPQLTSLQSALAVAPTPPPAAPNPQVVTVLQSVPVTTTAAAAVDLHGSSNLLLVSQPPAPAELLTNTHAGLKMAVGHNGVDEKDVAVPRPKKRKISGK
ncbi:hypothetical protein L596_023771 [Steinernema carpocapsae]|uniref:HTH CENPB-type domain-containing protein n=1 Tax=Steinernema carpocapsae TaxID=34508 RepID=A0A4U5MFE8_STECR|nr:hypothetical protein L596_023771 [Steinernema carpocapsae]